MGAFRVGVLTSHPIQCQAPLFRALAEHPSVDLKVFFGSDHGVRSTHDPQFGVRFAWDVPLLDGYEHEFLPNVASRPDVNTYGGVDTPAVADRIRDGRFDAFVVMGWYLKSSWQAFRACRRTRTPLILRGISYLHMPPRGRVVRLAKRWRLGRLFKRCDAFLTIGRENEAFYRHFGADPSRFVHTPHAVDNMRFATEAARWRTRRAEVRRQWELPENGCVFLFSGKLIEKKRPLDAIRAVGRLNTSSEVALLVAGDGEWRARCEQEARDAGRGRVRFAGFLNQSEMPRAYAAADVLVMPSGPGETWGLAVNEAMACALPAIASDRVGGAPDLVVPGLTGYVVHTGRVDALAGAMDIMAADPTGRRLMGLAAKQRVDGYGISAAVEGVVRGVELAAGVADARRSQPCVPADQWQPSSRTRGAA